jgi:hypothetical protein
MSENAENLKSEKAEISASQNFSVSAFGTGGAITIFLDVRYFNVAGAIYRTRALIFGWANGQRAFHVLN